MSNAISPNARRWLNVISFAEGTWGGGAPRYDITFGYQPIKDLSRHPDRVVRSGGYSSAAAGAYQFMPGTWADMARQQGLKDFGPASQDLAALALIRQKGVDPDRDPITPQTVAKLSGTWASLPNLQGKSAYGQPVKSFETLSQFAAKQGGSQQAAPSPDSKVASLLLLNKFIDLLGTAKDNRQLATQSSLSAPEIPSYDEDSESDPQAELLLSLARGRDQTEAIESSMKNAFAEQLQANQIAAEQARAKLLSEALNAYSTPVTVVG